MADFWKTPEFSKLSRLWADKLSESGFVDVEKEKKDGERTLIVFSSEIMCNRHKGYLENKTEFFALIDEWLQRDKKIPRIDRYVMTRYAEGAKQKVILKELEQMGVKWHRITITRTISRCLERWNIPLLKPRKTK